MTTAVILTALAGLFIGLVVAIQTVSRRDETIAELRRIQTAILRERAAIAARTPIRGERGRFTRRDAQ